MKKSTAPGGSPAMWTGLGDALPAGAVVTLIAASTAVAAMVAARRLGGEAPARAAAPFLTVGPAAIWMCVSAEAVFAAVAISAGPWVGAGIAVAIVEARRRPGDSLFDRGRRGTAWLTLAGILMCVTAALSQMSRAEVERIWLPFVPWMLLGTGLLPAEWRRIGLIAQVAFAVVIQTLLYTRWWSGRHFARRGQAASATRPAAG